MENQPERWLFEIEVPSKHVQALEAYLGHTGLAYSKQLATEESFPRRDYMPDMVDWVTQPSGQSVAIVTEAHLQAFAADRGIEQSVAARVKRIYEARQRAVRGEGGDSSIINFVYVKENPGSGQPVMGLVADALPDLLALLDDKTTGIPNVGPKTQDLLRRYDAAMVSDGSD